MNSLYLFLILFLSLNYICFINADNLPITYYITVNQSSTNYDCIINQNDCTDIYSALLSYYEIQNSSTSLYIELLDGVYTGVNNTNLSLNNLTLTIAAASSLSPSVTIDLQYNNSFITITNNFNTSTNLTLESLNIINGNRWQGGAVLYFQNEGQPINVTLRNVYAANHISDFGSVFFIEQDALDVTLTAIDCVFTNNTATIAGSVLYTALNMVANFQNCIFSENRNTSMIEIHSAFLSIKDSVITNNVGNNTLLTLNFATLQILIDNTTFTGNQLLTTSTSVSPTTDPSDGVSSFIKLFKTSGTIQNSVFRNNSGGSILRYYSPYTYPLIVQLSTFDSNWCGAYGTIYVEEDSSMVVESSNFTSNVATVNAAAVYFNNDNSAASYTQGFTNVTFSKNRVVATSGSTSGKANDIYAQFITLYLSQVTFGNIDNLTTPIYCNSSIVNFEYITANINSEDLMKCNQSTCQVFGSYKDLVCKASHSSDDNDSSETKLGADKIGGIVIGSIAGVFLITFLMYLAYERIKKYRNQKHNYQLITNE